MEDIQQLAEQVLKAASNSMRLDTFDAVFVGVFLAASVAKFVGFMMERLRLNKSDDKLSQRLLRICELALADMHPHTRWHERVWHVYIPIFSASLMIEITNRIFKSHNSSGQQQNSVNITVVGILIGRKAKQLSVTYVLLSIAMISYLFFSFWANHELNAAVLFFISAFYLVAFINEKSLEYRIKHGLYGSNEHEAREILSFILNHADKTDFTSGGGLREIIPAPEPDHVYGAEPVEGVRGVLA